MRPVGLRGGFECCRMCVVLGDLSGVRPTHRFKMAAYVLRLRVPQRHAPHREPVALGRRRHLLQVVVCVHVCVWGGEGSNRWEANVCVSAGDNQHHAAFAEKGNTGAAEQFKLAPVGTRHVTHLTSRRYPRQRTPLLCSALSGQCALSALHCFLRLMQPPAMALTSVALRMWVMPRWPSR